MSIMSNIMRKALVLGWMARAGNAAFVRMDAFGGDGVSAPAGRSFARFCAVFRERVKKIRCRSAAAGVVHPPGRPRAGDGADPCRPVFTRALHRRVPLPLRGRQLSLDAGDRKSTRLNSSHLGI